MAAYKVINLDSPIESDYWVDIPVRDPATNKDAVDEKGRILVERHVTRSVKNEELSNINTAVETVHTLKEDYSTFKEEVSTIELSPQSHIHNQYVRFFFELGFSVFLMTVNLPNFWLVKSIIFEISITSIGDSKYQVFPRSVMSPSFDRYSYLPCYIFIAPYITVCLGNNFTHFIKLINDSHFI